MRKRNRLSAESYIKGILEGDRVILSRAITVIESNHPLDLPLADEILEGILPHTGNSLRIGITGVPGVGKSTFIESFGKTITTQGKKLAVLTIDPSSQRSKGSILGDKTRMEELSHDPLAYIRPSASGSTLGGVNQKTRETMLLCEAAGHEVILVETVGVGQSETAVHGMVDFFLLLMLAGAGDELQGMKKGIMEMADLLVITKADGDNKQKCKLAASNYRNALHLFPPTPSGWEPKVQLCSSVEKDGLEAIWETMDSYFNKVKINGYFQHKREEQHGQWLEESINAHLRNDFFSNLNVKSLFENIEPEVVHGKTAVSFAARKLLQTYKESTN
ncbi:methylmalonyl Co-A mutase-associated GTPase MeaB [Sediminitomix flava]|uniref:Methylmalonyl-CoA mutase metallochaperone MeaB n=1 Tax=Sediminitomix flava TaxID=379075 RepID=A0A315Z9V6_SEDFL|nr:methylmalonyl Co-A mutase-associated GTPase MeaB [Sediminitomix flava]PWJ42120.1 methylmalonyl-CoA mutase metallochaperone MeaB [Sediminitomix flava]